MSPPDIAEIRAEHAQEGIGEAVYGILWEAVRMTATRYPPRIYSSSEGWDEATLRELLHDWIAERLLRGDLSVMVASSASAESLRRQLSTSLTQLLVNRRRRDSAGNLYRRTLRMLRNNPAFAKCSAGADQQAPWKLAEDASDSPSPLRLEALVRLAYQLSDDELEVVRYGPRSLKSSPILREPALERFLRHLLGGAGGGLSPARIAEVMQHRFSLVRERAVEFHEQIADDELVDLRIESESLAASIRERLDPTDVGRLRALAETEWNVKAAAERRGDLEATVRSTSRRLTALITEYAEDEQQAAEVLRKVLESLFMEEDGD